MGRGMENEVYGQGEVDLRERGRGVWVEEKGYMRGGEGTGEGSDAGKEGGGRG